MTTKPTNRTLAFSIRSFLFFICVLGIQTLQANGNSFNVQHLKTGPSDSLTLRRDEYFKDVQIIIDDKPAGVFIDKLYKKLSQEQKEHYLSYIPKKKTAEVLSESNYNSFINKKEAVFLLDNKITTRDELLKYKREDFAGGGSKSTETGKQVFFYTHAYFAKHIRSIYDHYPNKVYKITILNEALEYQPDFVAAPVKKTYERNGSEDKGYKVALSYMSFGYTDELKKRAGNIYSHFPGGNEKFAEYLFSHLQMPYKPEKLQVSYTVNTDGTLSDIDMSEDTDPLLLKEVQRVMYSSPRWIPDQTNGRPQRIGTRDTFENKLK